MIEERISILGVPFDGLSQKAVLERLDQACDGNEQLFCVTPNPEICLRAQEDEDFMSILRGADLSIPDGFGILWAARFLDGSPNTFAWLWTLITPWLTKKKSPLKRRVTGTDVMQSFCKYYPTRKVFLLGASKSVNDALAQKLKDEGVQVVGNYSGDASDKLSPIIVSMINASDAEILFVAFGAPKQERWIRKHLKQLKKVRVAMGIGGAFDFLVGKRKRAPKWMRSIGLEWLFRLIIEPKRIKRILNATVVFPWRVFISSKTPYN